MEQKKMVQEMRRCGRAGYLQTPNKFFFMEPHFLFPFFQFLPVKWKVFMLMNFRLGHYAKVKERDEAFETARSIRLVSKKELQLLFPDIPIFIEKWGLLTKSFYLFYGEKSYM